MNKTIKYKLYKDINWLIEQYWGFDLSLVVMGKLANCSNACIMNWMNKYNIPTRYKFKHLQWLDKDKEHQSKAGKARAKWTNEHYSHLARKRLLENNIGYLMHIKWKERDPEGYRQHQINAGVKGGIVMRKRLTDWDFYNKHGCLKSQYPYPNEFNKKLKKQVFDRDGRICQFCYKLVCNGHAIHHIDYDKNNNKLSNLILLCSKCHNRTNVYNKEYWTRLFYEKNKKLMTEKETLEDVS